MESSVSPISANVRKVLDRIAAAAARTGRGPDAVTLIAVSKTVEADDVARAHEAGIRHFGENRVQELERKRGLLDLDCTWHLIGSLQTNKAKDALRLSNLIHSLDSLRLAQELDKRAAQMGVIAQTLVQVNISQEDTKSGIAPEEALEFLRSLGGFANLTVRGLMTIAQPAPDPEQVRPEFRHMKQLFEEAKSIALPNVHMEVLSMGMSGDFEVAIEEGSNMVRVGTAIFGSRIYH